MPLTSPDHKGIIANGRLMASALYPLLTNQALKLHSVLRAASRAENAAFPTFITLELPVPAADGAHGQGALGRLARFFNGRGAPAKTDYLRFINTLPSGATLALAGPEPLESPHFQAVLFQADARSLDVEISTCGRRLDECAPVIYGLGVARVRLSIFGPESVHNDVVGSSRSFKDAVRGSLALAGLRDSTTRPSLVVDLRPVPASFGRFEEMVECALVIGADLVIMHYPMLQGSPSPADAASCADELSRLRRRYRTAPLRFFPDLAGGDAERFILGDMLSVGPARCSHPWRGVRVDTDGKITICDSYAIGDLRTDSLESVYNCEAARSLRRNIKRGLLPGCQKCVGRFQSEDALR